MSEYRQNPTNGQWVIIATERAKKPEDFAPLTSENPRPHQPAHSPNCPFCRGGDVETADASVEMDGANGEWTVRIIPNKYASVSRNGSPQTSSQGLFVKGDGYGVSDVVVETPDHNRHLALLEPDQVSLILEAMRLRFIQLREDPALRVINLFRNHGPRAGASLIHPHAQMIATSIVPPHISNQIHYARRWHSQNGCCVYCKTLAEELRFKERVIVETEHFVAWSPFASRSPFETRIQPKRHMAFYSEISAEELADFGRLLHDVLGRLYTALFDPDYNYILRSAAAAHHNGSPDYYHWYMVIIPKLSHAAGMEIGTGIYINPVAPEVAASILRSASSLDLSVREATSGDSF